MTKAFHLRIMSIKLDNDVVIQKEEKVIVEITAFPLKKIKSFEIDFKQLQFAFLICSFRDIPIDTIEIKVKQKRLLKNYVVGIANIYPNDFIPNDIYQMTLRLENIFVAKKFNHEKLLSMHSYGSIKVQFHLNEDKSTPFKPNTSNKQAEICPKNGRIGVKI
ncbi:hypothetical protein TRFO_34171 [Tritrichomonas foetus]|uniref:Uncharacterized protein n=1 Tax=Tritrichomonas foetus TaxID=1144522 RepID=A0A1J4JPF4_9EUKA|nr:hypothetical protein TRFO_34171 [Tritrichomonas foetus]|eukprot:OHS99397.1 hypothetical protein TRFO_34171 [Tritrichomonas foetus]